MCRELSPELVLMDVRMPAMDGLEATRRIKREMPRTSVVMVTMHENPDYLFEAVKAGAAGYVSKDASGERLLGAVRRTLEGESPLNQEAGDEALGQARQGGEGRRPCGGIQGRACGIRACAARRVHVRSILTKLGVSDRIQAICAIEFRLTTRGID